MPNKLELGITGRASCIVTEADTAKAVGSGGVDVMSTPRLVALMENAAKDSVANCLEEGMTTVGTALNIQHMAATPVGMKCTAESKLIEIDRRRLVFELTAYDDVEVVGKGTHERFIVGSDKFVAKCNAKKKA